MDTVICSASAQNMSATSRIYIGNLGNLLSVRIPIRRNWRAMIWVLMAAIPWTLVLFILVQRSQLVHAISWAPLAYLLAIVLWFGVGIAGYTFISWMFFGREHILVSAQQVLIEKPLVFYNRRNYYKTEHIKGLKVGVEIFKAREKGVWIDRERTIITFEYPGKKVIFARGTSPKEAQEILLAIAKSGYVSADSFAADHVV